MIMNRWWKFDETRSAHNDNEFITFEEDKTFNNETLRVETSFGAFGLLRHLSIQLVG